MKNRRTVFTWAIAAGVLFFAAIAAAQGGAGQIFQGSDWKSF